MIGPDAVTGYTGAMGTGQKTASTDPDFPLRLGNPEDFARVRTILRAPGFEESTVHRILRRSGYSALGSESVDQDKTPTPEPNALMKLFIELKRVPRSEVEEATDRATVEAFLRLDLIRVCEDDASGCFSPVFLHPVGEFLIASDHYNKSSGPESVFPAIHTGTLRLLSLLPASAATDGLDVGSGTGILAFALAKDVQRVVASDITARATHFARFNRLLNDCGDVDIVQGDLYGSVEGRTFDRIVSHPPLAPSVDGVEIWRDGGSTGDALTQRIVEGLPEFLSPGGEFFSVCLISEHNGVPAEQRVREWLGTQQHEFDVILAVQMHMSPRELAQRATARNILGEGSDSAAKLEAAFRQAGVTRFAYGALGIQRQRTDGAKAWTLKTKLSAKSDRRSFETSFERNRQCSSPADILDFRPGLSPNLKVAVGHRVDESKLVPSDLTMETDWPFAHGTKADAWIFPLISRFNGNLKIAKVYEKARADGLVPANFRSEDFASLVAMMIRHGYLTLGGAALPTK